MSKKEIDFYNTQTVFLHTIYPLLNTTYPQKSRNVNNYVGKGEPMWIRYLLGVQKRGKAFVVKDLGDVDIFLLKKPLLIDFQVTFVE
ncbi:MAG: hypothetical protein AB8B69_10060 [Chitinophagales bacterium]